MSLCKVCNTRKGKRNCDYDQKTVCSECCGKTRTQELCTGCDYYAPPVRRYQDVPKYSISEMENDFDLQVISNAIEGSICSFDDLKEKTLKDPTAIRIIENLLDKYYFNEKIPSFDNSLIEEGFHFVDKVITKDLNNNEKAKLPKILSLIRFVAKRRSQERREYISFIYQYVGLYLGKGVRMMNR